MLNVYVQNYANNCATVHKHMPHPFPMDVTLEVLLSDIDVGVGDLCYT